MDAGRLRSHLVAYAEAAEATQEQFEGAALMTLVANALGQAMELGGGFLSYLRCPSPRHLVLLATHRWEDAAAVPIDEWASGPIAFVVDLYSTNRGEAMPAIAALAQTAGVCAVAATTRDGKYRIMPASDLARVAAQHSRLEDFLRDEEGLKWAA